LLDASGFRVVTQDQTWINDVGRPLGLDEESLKVHPMRHVLTMAIGAGAPLSINYYAIRLAAPAILLLSSDGLHGVLDSSAIEQILREDDTSESLEEKCRLLIEAAKNAGGPDNITVLLVRAK
jgi:protein phosphatase